MQSRFCKLCSPEIMVSNVITGVVKAATAELLAIDRDGTDYIIIAKNIVAFSYSRNDK